MGCVQNTSNNSDLQVSKSKKISKLKYSKTLYLAPYDNVINILNETKIKLESYNEDNLAKEIGYVISKVESKNLYKYSPSEEEIRKNTFEEKDIDEGVFKFIIDHLNEYSEVKKKKKENLFIKLAKRKDVKEPGSPKNEFLSKVEEKIEEIAFVVKDDEVINSVIHKDFNIFDFYREKKDSAFITIGKIAYQQLGLNHTINLNKLDSFLSAVKNGYLNPQYHNEIHGADVGLTLFNYLYYSSSSLKKISFSKVSINALITAGFCHDIGHPGFTNTFHINSISEYSINSNDKSVLETYHAIKSSKILLEPENNILDKYSYSQYKKFRKVFIEAILATDMIYHGRTNSNIRSRLVTNQLDDFIPDKEEDAAEIQQDIINFLMHTADLSHNSKKFDISYCWVERLTMEFINQGDQELHLGLPISFLCDRTKQDIPQSQIGFIKGVIMPSFEILIDLMPELEYLNKNIENNLNEWVRLKEDSKDKSNFIPKQNEKKVPFDINCIFFKHTSTSTSTS